MRRGLWTSENLRGLALLALAAYAVRQGYTPDDVDQIMTVAGQRLAEYKDVIISVTAISAALLDNLHYTKRRTELKKETGQ